jgi:ArsR family transcriptional regulator, zinc-responsive transcriptional repressor
VGDESYERTSDLFRLLSSPLRIELIDQLRASDAAVHELVAATGASQPLVSQNLRLLRAGGLLTATHRGRERVYSLADDHVSHIVADALRHAAESATTH